MYIQRVKNGFKEPLPPKVEKIRYQNLIRHPYILCVLIACSSFFKWLCADLHDLIKTSWAHSSWAGLHQWNNVYALRTTLVISCKESRNKSMLSSYMGVPGMHFIALLVLIQASPPSVLPGFPSIPCWAVLIAQLWKAEPSIPGFQFTFSLCMQESLNTCVKETGWFLFPNFHYSF